MCINVLFYAIDFCVSIYTFQCFCLIKRQRALSHRTPNINFILLISVRLDDYFLAQISGRFSHFGSVGEAAVRSKCRTS